MDSISIKTIFQWQKEFFESLESIKNTLKKILFKKKESPFKQMNTGS